MTRDDLRELRARAMMKAHGDLYTDEQSLDLYMNADTHSGDCTKQAWTCNRCFADVYRKQAEATMKAEEAAGLAVVPLNATEEMRDAALHTAGGVRKEITAANAAGNILTKEDG